MIRIIILLLVSYGTNAQVYGANTQVCGDSFNPLLYAVHVENGASGGLDKNLLGQGILTGTTTNTNLTTGIVLPATYFDTIKPFVSVKGNIATLTFTGTNIGSFQWYVQPGGQYIFGGSDYAAKTVTIAPGTKYTFTLTTWDKAGNKPVTTSVFYDSSIVVVQPAKDTLQVLQVYDRAGKYLTKVVIFTDGSGNVIKQ